MRYCLATNFVSKFHPQNMDTSLFKNEPTTQALRDLHHDDKGISRIRLSIPKRPSADETSAKGPR